MRASEAGNEIVLGETFVSKLRPVGQSVVASVRLPSRVVRIVREVALADVTLLQSAQVTPALVILQQTTTTTQSTNRVFGGGGEGDIDTQSIRLEAKGSNCVYNLLVV